MAKRRRAQRSESDKVKKKAESEIIRGLSLRF